MELVSLLIGYLLTVISVSCQSAHDCIFTDSHSNNIKLNLSSLYGEVLNFVDIKTKSNMSYAICQNKLSCYNALSQQTMNVSIGEYFKIPDSSIINCDWLQIFNNTDIQQPSYDDILQRWRFPPIVGSICTPESQRYVTNLYWICDQTVENAKIVNVTDPPSLCLREMKIASKYACPNSSLF